MTKQLEVAPSHIIWRSLAETVLARLVVFNKRTASEPVAVGPVCEPTQLAEIMQSRSV